MNSGYNGFGDDPVRSMASRFMPTFLQRILNVEFFKAVYR